MGTRGTTDEVVMTPGTILSGMILRHREHTGTSALRNIAKLISLNRWQGPAARIF